MNIGRPRVSRITFITFCIAQCVYFRERLNTPVIACNEQTNSFPLSSDTQRYLNHGRRPVLRIRYDSNGLHNAFSIALFLHQDLGIYPLSRSVIVHRRFTVIKKRYDPRCKHENVKLFERENKS